MKYVIKCNETIAPIKNPILYDYTSQENQGFQRFEDEELKPNTLSVKIPYELNKNSIKNRLTCINHPYAENERFVDYCCGFLKFLYIKQISAFDDHDGCVPLMAKIIAKYLGNNISRRPFYYKDILNALENIGVLHIDHRYSACDGNGNAKGYKLLLNEEHKTEFVTLDRKYLNSWRVDDDEYNSNLQCITINEERFVLLANILFKPKCDQGLRILNYWKSNLHFVAVDSNRRIHSLLTQLPKEYRNCLLIGDEPIHEVDIHACQPFFFIKMVVDELNYKKYDKKTLSEWIEVHSDLALYVKNIQEGRFYEHLYRELRKTSKEISKNEMTRFKTNVLAKVFFSDTQVNEERGVIRVFKKIYPTVYSTLLKIKSERGYEAVANNLQSIESEIMNCAIIELTQKSHGWYLRFHDAILCKEHECRDVSIILNNVIKNKIGAYGKVKSGLWGEAFTDVLNTEWVEYHDLNLYMSFCERMRNNFHRKRKKIFAGEEDLAEKRQKYGRLHSTHSDLSHLNYEESLEKTYTSTTLKVLQHWDVTKTNQFKEFSKNTIIDHLEKKLRHGNWFDRAVLNSNRKYWSMIYD